MNLPRFSPPHVYMGTRKLNQYEFLQLCVMVASTSIAYDKQKFRVRDSKGIWFQILPTGEVKCITKGYAPETEPFGFDTFRNLSLRLFDKVHEHYQGEVPTESTAPMGS